MSAPPTLAQARDAFSRQAWSDAYAHLAAADRDAALGPADLECLAVAAHLLGRHEASADALTRAHRAYVDEGDVERAARCAFWLAFGLLDQGDHARAGGWLSRAQRLLDAERRDCVERGYLLLPVALQRLGAGDAAEAEAAFRQAAEFGERYGDRDLTSLARQGQGRALIRQGAVPRGVALLDEVMVGVTAGEVSPIVVGTVYCSVIGACYEMFDLRRAGEWTDALHRWCVSQPDLVPFRGQCLTWRAEILQRQGAWDDALDEAHVACTRLAEPPQPALGAAYYRLAELHRLRGEITKAEDAYREASRHGRKPQPGLAQLRLAQGKLDAAARTIRGVLDESSARRTRSAVLPAYVEIVLAAGDVAAARAAVTELSDLAADLGALLLRAQAAHADGAVRLAEGDGRAAVAALRNAWAIWQQLEAPYDGARTRLLLGLACRTLGDDDTAELELDAARQVFRDLGAAVDLRRVDALSARRRSDRPGGLTAREVQVVRLVAAGKTNRAIAGELAISEKTVARHISNIFTKLGLSSRAAATAYAYEHGIIQRRR